MYSYESYYSDTIAANDFARIEAFLTECDHSTDPAAINMQWSAPAGFLYNVRHGLRWRTDQGKIFLILEQDRPVAVSCIEFSEHSPTWAVGGVRTWITPAHRSRQMAKFFLDQQLDWAAERNCNFILLTFNDYNQAAWRAVKSDAKYRRAANWSTWWDDCYAVPEKVQVRSMLQWCVIKPVQCADNQRNAEELILKSATK
jgi:GNAT superfamily N-acetyltransferase